MLSLLLAFALAAASDVHTVDDDGPADFSDIQAAVDATAAGDVLIVEPGTYGGFTLPSRRTVLGRAGGARPLVTGFVVADGVARVTLAGLDFGGAVVIRDVPGRAIVDDCRLSLGSAALPALTLVRCGQVELMRLDGTPSAPMQGSGWGADGIVVDDAFVSLVDSRVFGTVGFSPSFGSGFAGGDALVVRGDGVVLASATSFTGGAAGLGFPGRDGAAGDALRVERGTVVLRGAPTDTLVAGAVEPGFGGTPGQSLHVDDGLVVHSGVTLVDPLLVLGGAVVEAPAQEPWVEITGSDAPGDQRVVRIAGPSGAPAWLLAGLDTDVLPLAKLETPLWTSPALAAALVATVGFTTPLELPVDVPDDLELAGLAIHVHAAFPTIDSTLTPGTIALTAPAPWVLRP